MDEIWGKRRMSSTASSDSLMSATILGQGARRKELDQFYGAFEQTLTIIAKPMPVAVGFVDGHIAVGRGKIVNTLHINQDILLSIAVGRFRVTAAAMQGIKNAGMQVFEIPINGDCFFCHAGLMGWSIEGWKNRNCLGS